MMARRMLKSKIHRATVTEADLDYEGSITLDAALMDAADIREFEEVHVWNVTTGARLKTYAMVGGRGSGTVCINGAAAHLAKAGDLIIVATFADLKDSDCAGYRPKIVQVDSANKISR
jgi:aspartate 1-decarboxylase